MVSKFTKFLYLDTHGDEELGSLFSHAFGAMNFKGLAPLRDVEVLNICY